MFPNGEADTGVVLANGKILEAGGTAQEDQGSFALARFNSNGVLDPTFGDHGQVITKIAPRGGIGLIAVQKDGKILAAGIETDGYLEHSHIAVARYLPNGQLDGTFGSGGITIFSSLVYDLVNGLAIRPDGKILLLGSHQFALSPSAIVQLTPNGALEKTFGSGGVELTANVQRLNALALEPNGDVLVGGLQYNSDYSKTPSLVGRFLPNGLPDTTFGPGGFQANAAPLNDVYNIALQSDGKILLLGTTGTLTNMQVDRLLPNGKLDRSFANSGIAWMSFPTDSSVAMAIQKSGNIVISNGSQITRFRPGGARDNTFGVSGIATMPAHFTGGTLLLAADDGLVGITNAPTATSGFGLFRMTADGQPMNSFGYHGALWSPRGISGKIGAIAVQKDGKIVVAGSELSTVKGIPQAAAVARYNRDGTLDTSFGVNGRVYIEQGRSAAFDALLIENNGDIVAGGFGKIGVEQVFMLTRLLASGKVDTSFGRNGSVLTSFGDGAGQTCAALALQSNGMIVAAGSTLGQNTQMAVARYRQNGSLDPHFGTAGKLLLNPLQPFSHQATAIGVAVLKDGKIMLGGNIGPDFALVRLQTDGSYDPTFGAGGIVATAVFDSQDPSPQTSSNQCNAMAIDAMGRIVLGGSVGDFPFSQAALVRYLPDGTLDPTYGSGGMQTIGPSPKIDFDSPSITCLAIEPNGQIVGGGPGGLLTQLKGAIIVPAAQALALQANGKILSASGSDLSRWLAP